MAAGDDGQHAAGGAGEAVAGRHAEDGPRQVNPPPPPFRLPPSAFHPVADSCARGRGVTAAACVAVDPPPPPSSLSSTLRRSMPRPARGPACVCRADGGGQVRQDHGRRLPGRRHRRPQVQVRGQEVAGPASAPGHGTANISGDGTANRGGGTAINGGGAPCGGAEASGPLGWGWVCVCVGRRTRRRLWGTRWGTPSRTRRARRSTSS